jgi:serine/threonine protein kinase
MMDKPVCRAFVSSTYIDLKGHRSRVIDALRKSGIHIDPMEDWTADDREPKQFSQQRVDGCRLCILLVAFRRGFVPEGEMLSITQMEYDHAVRSGVAVLPFLLGDDEPWPRCFDEMEKDPGIRLWREQLRRDHGVGTFGFRPESLDIGPAVLRWLQQSNAEAPPQHLSHLLQARADRNLLYGVLALQMDFVNRDALIRAMNAWILEKAKPLGEILREHGGLTEDEHTVLETLVRKHLERHGQDVRESLAAMEPNGALAADLARLPDLQIQASVVTMQSRAPHPPIPETHFSAGDHYSWPTAYSPGLDAAKACGMVATAPLRYRILEPHRRGGLGEVFVAQDVELGRKVALKQLREEYADHPDSRARFLLEAEITGGLEHPGIVPVYGLCAYPDGRPFYAMRFVQGESLREAIQCFHKAEAPGRDPGERALALRGLLNHFVVVCNAIAYAHSRGVLHRDLKPANVMLGPYGETLVVDWGLAKLLATTSIPDAGQELLRPASASGSAPTQLGSGIGTPEYMAPEQTAGRADAVGPHTDVYGLGAVLFEILTGRPPHDRHSRTPDPPRAQIVQPSTPAALDEIAARAMDPAPGNRYPTASGLAEAVQRWLAEEPVASYRALVSRLEKLADSRPDVLDYREELARNRVNLGLVLSGMARHADAADTFRSAVAEYEAVAEARPNAVRHRADLATARLHLSQALTALHRSDEAEKAREAAVADYDWLMATNPDDYRTNLASVLLTMMPQWKAPADQQPPEQSVSGENEALTPSPAQLPPEGVEEAAGLTTMSTLQPPPGPPAAVPVPEQPAELRARFTPVRELGRGGAARVWIARDNDLNREVAIKETLLGIARHDAHRQRFFKEAQITSQLEHPNIVPVYGLGYRSDGEAPFLIMRYVRGRNLKEAIQEYHSRRQNAQEFRRLLRSFVGACNGLAFAHSRGVLHRDPKPANIMLGDNGEVYVVDWGLAKVRDSHGRTEGELTGVSLTWVDPLTTPEGALMGTPVYMAPEMAAGRQDLVDARTDIYVLGAGLFEILTGRLPYQGPDPTSVLHAIVTSEPPRARSVRPQVPPALDAVCARAMARRREDRYATASELGEDVERWLEGEPVAAYPESLLRRWARRLWGRRGVSKPR